MLKKRFMLAKVSLARCLMNNILILLIFNYFNTFNIFKDMRILINCEIL